MARRGGCPRLPSQPDPFVGAEGAERADKEEMVIGRSDEQLNPPDSMALTTPRECLVLLGGTHLGHRLSAAQTGRTHDRNRIEHQSFLEKTYCTQGAVHT
jgi:hypothetical protein